MDFSLTEKLTFEVCINGGAGGIGQPLTMLMAMNETVKEAVLRGRRRSGSDVWKGETGFDEKPHILCHRSPCSWSIILEVIRKSNGFTDETTGLFRQFPYTQIEFC